MPSWAPPDPEAIIQMDANQGVTIRRFSTYDGKYGYDIYRSIAGASEALVGKFDNGSELLKEFGSFSQPHNYRIVLRYLPGFEKKKFVLNEDAQGVSVVEEIMPAVIISWRFTRVPKP